MQPMYPVTMKNSRYEVRNTDLLELCDKYGTPLYVYDLDTVKEKYHDLISVMDYPRLKIFFAMKSNFNPDLLKCLNRLGSGIDAVSIGEIYMAKKVGFSSERIIYTANNITDEEMDRAVAEGVLINIGELSRLEKFAERYPGAEVCLRINPEVVAGEHEMLHTSGVLAKFGILIEDLPKAGEIADRYHLKIVGIHEHTGSGISNSDKVLEAIKVTLNAARDFPGLKFIDFGGGFKVPYAPDEKTVDYPAFGRSVGSAFQAFCDEYGEEIEMYFEPGKLISAQCGMFMVQVNTLRNNRGRLFAGVNSGFSQFIRPVLYNAFHHVLNLSNPAGPEKVYDVVGNICEGGDILARERSISEIREGDCLCFQNAGAYCCAQSGIYNLRPRPGEVCIEGGRAWVSSERKSPLELAEKILEDRHPVL